MVETLLLKKAKSRPRRVLALPDNPLVSIVIPVFNEEGIVYSSIESLLYKMADFNFDYEIILSENGSRDGTLEIAQDLARAYKLIRVQSHSEPNYGQALKNGILGARGAYVICDEIDLCDTNFYYRALSILMKDQADMVVGSKLMNGARDDRPLNRRLASYVLNRMLRHAAGFNGTDTHGLKAFKRRELLPVVRACKVDRDLFASEFVIRTERTGLRVKEVPVQVREKRTPSIILSKRVPRALYNVAQLAWLFRVRERFGGGR